MAFYAILDQIVDLLRSRQRRTYRTLKRQFDLDDATLEDVKEELLFAPPQIADEDGRGLVWTRDTAAESALRQAETLAMSLDDSRRLAEVLSRLSRHCCFDGAYDQALAMDMTFWLSQAEATLARVAER